MDCCCGVERRGGQPGGLDVWPVRSGQLWLGVGRLRLGSLRTGNWQSGAVRVEKQ